MREAEMTLRSQSFLLGPGLRSRCSPSEVLGRLRATDLAAVDIDGCLFPGFSQSSLGHWIFFAIATRPAAAADRLLLPRLVRGGAYIRRVELVYRLTGRLPGNRELMQRYVQSMREIPEEYFRRGARTLPRRSFRGVQPALRLLGQRALVGLVSFSIDLVAEEYRRQLNLESPCVGFVESNRIAFAPGRDGRPRFVGYVDPVRTGPRDKRRVLEDRLARHGARSPLVVGNGPDDAGMAELARERGGLSVGFRPWPGAEAAFDVVVESADWGPLVDLFRRALG